MEINTLHDLLINAKNHKDKRALGQRKVVATKKENRIIGKEQKEWLLFQLGPYEWITYNEFHSLALSVGQGLRDLGLQKGDVVCLYSKTCVDWQIMAHACFSQSITIATAYESLGLNALSFILEETECKAVFVHVDLIPKLQFNKTVIYHGGESDFLGAVSLDSLKKTPKNSEKPSKDTLAAIMYTSGSTGQPKGVMLTHGNIVSAALSWINHVGHYINTDDVFLAYLPLAHVLEFVIESVMILKGVQMGYGSPRTLSDLNVYNSKGDINELKPTLLAGVPTVWDTIKKGILSKLKERSALVRGLCLSAINLRFLCSKYQIPLGFLFSSTILRPIIQQTGGRLRYCISGGAPIHHETQRFLSGAICPLVQGYGMTETCGACFLQNLSATESNAGSVVPGVEVKLRDLEYEDQSGELLIKGPNVFNGYFKNKTETDLVLKDGWLHTGDIALKNKDGTYSIIDRIKNLVKLANGEYIALEKLESIYATNEYAQRVCLYADSNRVFVICIMQPNLNVLKLNPELSYKEILSLKETKDQVLSSLLKTAKENSLCSAEQIKGLIFSKEEWTPDNFLTAAQKLRRKEIYKQFIDESIYE